MFPVNLRMQQGASEIEFLGRKEARLTMEQSVKWFNGKWLARDGDVFWNDTYN